MKATLSILGLLEMDPTILNGITLPEGLDLDILKNNIILECAELEVLYSAPSFFRWAVDSWSLKEYPTWEKMYKALQIEYNPLENYDRHEEWDETGNSYSEKNETGTRENKATSTSKNDTTDTETRHDDHYIFGYNDNAQVKQSMDDSNGTSKGNSTGTATGSETGSDVRNGTENGNRTENRIGHVHGNIGVVSSQQMLRQEFELAPDVNMYNIITRSFRNRFCLLIY